MKYDPQGWLSGRTNHELPEQEMYDVLSNERRRELLAELDSEDGKIDLGELVDAVAAAETDDAEEVPPSVRSSVYAALVQTHLPMMEDRNIVEYDDDEDVIRETDKTAVVYRHLRYSPSSSIWSLYYLAVAVCYVLFVVLVELSVPPFARISGTETVAIMVSTLCIVLLAHYLTVRGS